MKPPVDFVKRERHPDRASKYRAQIYPDDEAVHTYFGQGAGECGAGFEQVADERSA